MIYALFGSGPLVDVVGANCHSNKVVDMRYVGPGVYFGGYFGSFDLVVPEVGSNELVRITGQNGSRLITSPINETGVNADITLRLDENSERQLNDNSSNIILVHRIKDCCSEQGE